MKRQKFIVCIEKIQIKKQLQNRNVGQYCEYKLRIYINDFCIKEEGHYLHEDNAKRRSEEIIQALNSLIESGK